MSTDNILEQDTEVKAYSGRCPEKMPFFVQEARTTNTGQSVVATIVLLLLVMVIVLVFDSLPQQTRQSLGRVATRLSRWHREIDLGLRIEWELEYLPNDVSIYDIVFAGNKQ